MQNSAKMDVEKKGKKKVYLEQNYFPKISWRFAVSSFCQIMCKT